MLCICLSGGGANGAFQVGALKYILQRYRPDAYCGVSVGAINAAFLSQYSRTNDYRGVLDLETLWGRIDNDSIYKKWFYGVLWYLPALWKPSIYDTSPVRRLISTHLEPAKIQQSGKLLRVVGVSLNTGEAHVWSEHSADIVQGVQASSSFPVFFTPITRHQQVYSDGGIRSITPLKTAIDLGATRIIVVTCSPEKVQYHSYTKLSTLEQVTRMLDIMCNEINRDDLKKAFLHNKLAKAHAVTHTLYPKRYVDITVVQPGIPLGDSLDFSPSKNKLLRERGYETAKKVFDA